MTALDYRDSIDQALLDALVVQAVGGDKYILGSNGIYTKQTPSNVSYDGTGRKRGVLMGEDTQTNLLLSSMDFTNGNWSNVGTFASVTTAGIQPAFSGDANITAAKYTNSNAGGRLQTVTTVASSIYSNSVVIENVDALKSAWGFYESGVGWIGYCDFTWATKTAAFVTGSGSIQLIDYEDLGTGPNGGDMVRFWLTEAAASTSTICYVYPCDAVANSLSAIVHQGQMENSEYPTSPIYTHSATESRTNDAFYLDMSKVPFDMAEGTIVLEYEGAPVVRSVATYRALCRLYHSADPVNNFVDLRVYNANNDPRMFAYIGGATQTSDYISATGDKGHGITRVAYSHRQNEFRGAASDGNWNEDLSGVAPPAFDRLYIGGANSSTVNFGGYLRKIKLFPEVLTAADQLLEVPVS